MGAQERANRGPPTHQCNINTKTMKVVLVNGETAFNRTVILIPNQNGRRTSESEKEGMRGDIKSMIGSNPPFRLGNVILVVISFLAEAQNRARAREGRSSRNVESAC
jgi:hypothetical protein